MAKFSTHNPPGAAAGKRPARFALRVGAASATIAPLPVLNIGDRITRPCDLLTPADEIGEGSISVARPSQITTPGESAAEGGLVPCESLAAGLFNLHPRQGW
jgi:hypothetical protein